MSTGTLERTAAGEGGDDRDPAILAAKEEIAQLNALMEESDSRDMTLGSSPEGGRALYSNVRPKVIGSVAVARAVEASTQNYAAGTYREAILMQPSQSQRRMQRLGSLTVMRYQGQPARPRR